MNEDMQNEENSNVTEKFTIDRSRGIKISIKQDKIFRFRGIRIRHSLNSKHAVHTSAIRPFCIKI